MTIMTTMKEKNINNSRSNNNKEGERRIRRESTFASLLQVAITKWELIANHDFRSSLLFPLFSIDPFEPGLLVDHST